MTLPPQLPQRRPMTTTTNTNKNVINSTTINTNTTHTNNHTNINIQSTIVTNHRQQAAIQQLMRMGMTAMNAMNDGVTIDTISTMSTIDTSNHTNNNNNNHNTLHPWTVDMMQWMRVDQQSTVHQYLHKLRVWKHHLHQMHQQWVQSLLMEDWPQLYAQCLEVLHVDDEGKVEGLEGDKDGDVLSPGNTDNNTNMNNKNNNTNNTNNKNNNKNKSHGPIRTTITATAIIPGTSTAATTMKELQTLTEQLCQEQHQLNHLLDEIEARMVYFQQLESFTQLLNSTADELYAYRQRGGGGGVKSGGGEADGDGEEEEDPLEYLFSATSIQNDPTSTNTSTTQGTQSTSTTTTTFLTMLDKLDQCQAFLHAHRAYKDAALYAMRYQQCMTRALTLVSLFFRVRVGRMGAMTEMKEEGMKEGGAGAEGEGGDDEDWETRHRARMEQTLTRLHHRMMPPASLRRLLLELEQRALAGVGAGVYSVHGTGHGGTNGGGNNGTGTLYVPLWRDCLLAWVGMRQQVVGPLLRSFFSGWVDHFERGLMQNGGNSGNSGSSNSGSGEKGQGQGPQGESTALVQWAREACLFLVQQLVEEGKLFLAYFTLTTAHVDTSATSTTTSNSHGHSNSNGGSVGTGPIWSFHLVPTAVDTLRAHLDTLANTTLLDDHLRPRVIRERHIARLARLSLLLRDLGGMIVLMLAGEGAGSGHGREGGEGQGHVGGVGNERTPLSFEEQKRQAENRVLASVVVETVEAFRQDVQSRLVFRTQAFLRHELFLCRPLIVVGTLMVEEGEGSGGNGGGGEPLRAARRPSLSKQQPVWEWSVNGMFPSTAKTGPDATNASSLSLPSPLKDHHTGEDYDQDVDLSVLPYRGWHPALYRTLYLLSKLHQAIHDPVFEEITMEVVGLCLTSLKEAAQAIRAQSTQRGVLDGLVFLASHLLVLREEVFGRYAYALRSGRDRRGGSGGGGGGGAVYSEKSLDFSNLFQAVSSVLHRRPSLSQSGTGDAKGSSSSPAAASGGASGTGGGLLDLVYQGIPSVVEIPEHTQHDLDMTLKETCDALVAEVTKAILEPLAPHLLRSSLRHQQDASSARQQRSTAATTATETELQEAYSAFEQCLEHRYPFLKRKVSLFLQGQAALTILEGAVQLQIVDGYRRFYALADEQYGKMLTLRWLSVDAVRTLLVGGDANVVTGSSAATMNS